jgi:uncharacterized iron-regulated membrane protein
MKTKISNWSKLTRRWRKIHRLLALVSFAIFLLMSLTGILLAWKKNSGGYLQAESHKGTVMEPFHWLSADSLMKNAGLAIRHIDNSLDLTIDRIDIRPDKGMAKVIFKHHYWAVQLDMGTGTPLLVERRRSDFIEQLHDGSIIDIWLGTGFGKLSYSSLAGVCMLLMSVSGFVLWLSPRRIRQVKRLHNPR